MKKILILPLTQFMYSLSLITILLCSFTYAQAQLVINTTVEETEEEVVVDFQVQNFIDILSMQFSVVWDENILEYESVQVPNDSSGINMQQNNFGVTAALEEGYIVVSWLDSNLLGFTVENGTPIFQLRFNKLSDIGTAISFSYIPVPIEIIALRNGNSREIPLVSYTNEVIGQNLLRGYVFQDENEDCILGDGEFPLGGWQIEVSSEDEVKVVETLANGSFTVAVATAASYSVRAIPPLALWTLCEESYVVNVNDVTQELPQLAFGAKEIISCPLLQVDVSTPFLRRCFPNTYSLQYANIGTAAAENAFAIITLDPTLDFQSSTVPATDLGNNEFRFDLGNLAVGSSGVLRFEVIVNCDESALGQTHCVEANIFPVVDCFKANPNWSEAELELGINCKDGEAVEFKITNTGTGDMTEPQEFSVFEDMIMLHQAGDAFELQSGEEYAFELPANGSTYRLETNQVANHPFQNLLGVALEGCGENAVGEFSLGQVTVFPLAARSYQHDTDCQENIGAYDPNDKQGFPKGFGEDRLLKQNTDLEYLIRFQNTGTDTAFNIVILDTLSSLLDPTSVKPLVASHPYRYEQLDKQVLKFTFPNIMLPDSNINEVASHGFIRFQIAQQADLEDDLLIENKAAIYFDFNEPIITNTTAHKIGEPVFETSSTEAFALPSIQASVLPNPFDEFTMIELKEVAPLNTVFYLYDVFGRELRKFPFEGKQLTISRAGLEDGVYVFRLCVGEQTFYTDKLIIQD